MCHQIKTKTDFNEEKKWRRSWSSSLVPRFVSRSAATLVGSGPPTPVARTQSHKLTNPLLGIKTIAISIPGIIIIVIIVIIAILVIIVIVVIIIIIANQESSRVGNVPCVEMRFLALKENLDNGDNWMTILLLMRISIEQNGD